MSSEKDNKVHAITICGPPGVGKTSFANRLLNGSFPQSPLQSSSAIEFFAFPENKVKITVANKPAKDLLRIKALRDGQFKEADLILIVIDAKTLPSSQELEEYFKLALGEDLSSEDKLIYKNKSIHLVVNKMDQLDEPTKEAVKKGVAVLLEIESHQNINAHYISAKNNDGIPNLRDQLGIPHPSHHPIFQSAIDETSLTKKMTSEGALAITSGVVAGVIAGFLGGPPLGIVVGMGAAALTLNASTVSEFLIKKFSKNNEEAMPAPMGRSEETSPSQELILDPPQQQQMNPATLESELEPKPTLEPELTKLEPELEPKPKPEQKLEPLQKKPIKIDFSDSKSDPALAKKHFGPLWNEPEPPKEKSTPQTKPDLSKKSSDNEPSKR